MNEAAQKQLQELKIIDEFQRRKAHTSLSDFITYMKKDYHFEWFHKEICNLIDKLHSGKIKKMMIFLPPQHGKSEISSRMFPAYALGRDPSTKIAVASYSPDLATVFNRQIQNYVDCEEYRRVFPNTRLLSPQIPMHERGAMVRNFSQFETVRYHGFVKTVGVGSSLTGTPVDIGIIDDPFKDREWANSASIRDKVWNWFTDVFRTRLHNDSKILMLFTRWHEDDIAGRLLDPWNEYYDKEEADEWTVIALPALKEAEENPFNTVHLNDPREIDEALWESKHSANKYIKRRRINPTSFASLDQQRPTAVGGNKIRGEWFNIISDREMPFNFHQVTTKYYIDGAFTEKAANDETGLLACSYFRGRLYIYNCIGVRKEMADFIPFFKEWISANHWSPQSRIMIELKASGYPLLSLLAQPEHGNLNTMGINGKTVALGKWNRVENTEPFLASGKVTLIRGGWNKKFIAQCEAFPNGTNDDMVDVLTYAIAEHFIDNNNTFETTESIDDLDLH